MAASILTQGITALRDAFKTAYPRIFVTDDNTAFNAAQTTANPAGGSTTVLNKAATFTDLSASSARGTISINGNTEFTNKQIACVGVAAGAASTTAGSRNVRTQTIGVQAGDNFVIGIDSALSDIS